MRACVVCEDKEDRRSPDAKRSLHVSGDVSEERERDVECDMRARARARVLVCSAAESLIQSVPEIELQPVG